MTYEKALQTAFDCQNACNLSGVARTFANDVLPAIWAEADRQQKGTNWVNEHPAVTLILDKLASLNGAKRSQEDYSRASAQISELLATAA